MNKKIRKADVQILQISSFALKEPKVWSVPRHFLVRKDTVVSWAVACDCSILNANLDVGFKSFLLVDFYSELSSCDHVWKRNAVDKLLQY